MFVILLKSLRLNQLIDQLTQSLGLIQLFEMSENLASKQINIISNVSLILIITLSVYFQVFAHD